MSLDSFPRHPLLFGPSPVHRLDRLTAHLGGAVATHLRVADHWCFPVIIGVLAWVGLALRRPAIVRLALGKDGAAQPTAGAQP